MLFVLYSDKRIWLSLYIELTIYFITNLFKPSSTVLVFFFFCLFSMSVLQFVSLPVCPFVSLSVRQSVSVAGPKRATSLSSNTWYLCQLVWNFLRARRQSQSQIPDAAPWSQFHSSNSNCRSRCSFCSCACSSPHPHMWSYRLLPLKLVQFRFSISP